MNKKFFVVTLENGNAVKTALKSWWRVNRGPTEENSRTLYFSLLFEGWSSDVVGDEVILISPQASNEEIDEPRILLAAEPNENVQPADLAARAPDFNVVSEIFTRFIEAYNQLKDHRVLRNQKDITGQLGEWVASVLFRAHIAENGINQYWDLIDAQNDTYQVKSHAKAPTTAARWSKIDYPADAPICYVIIVVFDPSYKLQELYKVPFHEAVRLRTGNFVLNWSQISFWRVEDLHELLFDNGLGFITAQ